MKKQNNSRNYSIVHRGYSIVEIRNQKRKNLRNFVKNCSKNGYTHEITIVSRANGIALAQLEIENGFPFADVYRTTHINRSFIV